MSDLEAIPRHEIPNNKLNGKSFSNWSTLDLWVLVISLVASVAAWVTLGPMNFVIISPVLLLLNARLPHGFGRIHNEILMSLYGWYLMNVLKGVVWRAENPKGSGLGGFLRRHGVLVRKGAPLPFDFVDVSTTDGDEAVKFSVLRETDAPYDHFFIGASGGAFASLSVSMQHQAVNVLAETATQIIAQSNLRVGVSYLRMNSPFDRSRIDDYLGQAMDVVIARPDDFELDEEELAYVARMRRNATQLMHMVKQAGSADTWYLIVLSIKRGREWERAKQGKLSKKEAYDLPIANLGRSMVRALSQDPLLGLSDVHCLGIAQLTNLSRATWDVTTIESYYEARQDGTIPATDEAIAARRKAEGDAFSVVQLQPFPQECIEISKEGGYVRFDNNYIATIRITQLPERARVDQMRSLNAILGAGCWVRQSVVGQAVSGEAETQQAILFQSVFINYLGAFKNNRVVANPKEERKKKNLAQQTEQISMHSVAQHFNLLITLVAASPDQLRHQIDELQSKLQTRGFRSSQVMAASRILPAAISGLFAINRL